MAEYIEREAAKRYLALDYAYAAAKLLDEVDAADVAPVVHAKWKNVMIARIDTTGYCGECGKQAVWRTRNKPYAICPNCGAIMDGE